MSTRLRDLPDLMAAHSPGHPAQVLTTSRAGLRGARHQLVDAFETSHRANMRRVTGLCAALEVGAATVLQRREIALRLEGQQRKLKSIFELPWDTADEEPTAQA